MAVSGQHVGSSGACPRGHGVGGFAGSVEAGGYGLIGIVYRTDADILILRSTRWSLDETEASGPCCRRSHYQPPWPPGAVIRGVLFGSGSSNSAKSSQKITLRLGLLANITGMRQPWIGLNKGFFTEEPGQRGNDAQDLDLQLRYRGDHGAAGLPGWTRPASAPTRLSTPWQEVHSGKAIKIMAPGAISGGAALVVKPSIRQRQLQLMGQKVATPSLGNTQDVALRYYPKTHRPGPPPRPAAGMSPSRRSSLTRTRCWSSSQARSRLRLGSFTSRTTPRWSRTAARCW